MPALGTAVITAGSAIFSSFAATAPISLTPGIGFGIAGGTSAILAGVSKLALLAASVGLQYALTPKVPKGQAGQEALKQTVKSPIAPHRLALGLVQTSGVQFFERWDPPYYWGGYILCSGETDGLDSLYINNQRVWIDGNGLATSVPFNDGVNEYIEVSYRNGTADQVIDPIIDRDFSGEYPSTFRQRGLTTVVIKARHGGSNHNDIWGNASFLPVVEFRFRGAKVYDPNDPAQDLNDATTWVWSDNAALCTAHYLTYQWAGRKAIVDKARIDWDQIKVAAARCGKWRRKADGSAERDFTVNGVIQASEKPSSVLQGLLAAMNAVPVVKNGEWYCVVQDKGTPAATLHSGLIVDHLSFQTEKPAHELYNTVRASFIADERNYTSQTTPPYIDSAALTADGQTLEASLSLPFTVGHELAQRLAKAAIQQNRLGRALTCTVDYEAKGWQIGDLIQVNIEGLSELDGVYRLTRRAWAGKFTQLQIVLEQHSNDAFDWNATNDVQPFELDDDVVEAQAA